MKINKDRIIRGYIVALLNFMLSAICFWYLEPFKTLQFFQMMWCIFGSMNILAIAED